MVLRRRSRAGVILASALAAVTSIVVIAGAQGGTPSAAGSSPTTPFGQPRAETVTLLTGDQVDVDDQGGVLSVRRGKGREGIPFTVRRSGGSTYAIPGDAQRLIAQGKVDRRLFDVAELVDAEYDDAHRTSTPLIVAYSEGRARGRSLMASADAAVRRSLPLIGGDAVSAAKSRTTAVWEALTNAEGGGRSLSRAVAPGVERVWLDARLHATLDRSVQQIGAPAAWEAGYDGKGVKVAVLDTGVDETHPDLAGVEIAQKNFSAADDGVDRRGHGTHVAATIAGTGAKSGGKYKGVAPGAKILDAKVLDDDGSGEESQILAGMKWAVDQGAKVINMSLGDTDTPEVDPLEKAVNDLTADKGVLFVVAAGNDGTRAGAVGTPGSAASALTVGAVGRDESIAEFSSAGPTANGSLKPDITAPGVDIVAARATKSDLDDPGPDGYVTMSGTSMATPHVSGAAAVLAQRHPRWTGTRIKQALAASAVAHAGSTAFQQGTGRTDVPKALAQDVVGEQTSLGFGMQQWPHQDDKPVTKKVTYRNDSSVPVTFDLAVEVKGPDGQPAPEGMFATSAERVTVPPGGKASVDLTADTRRGGQDGAFGGALIATAGARTVRTAIAVEREVESYDLTLKAIDAKGRPGGFGAPAVYGLDSDSDVWEAPSDPDEDGTDTVRVPRGDYFVSMPVDTDTGGEDPDLAIMEASKVSLTKDTTLTFDARKAKPVKITPPKGAMPSDGQVDSHAGAGARTLDTTYFVGDWAKTKMAAVGDSAPADQYKAGIAIVNAVGDARYNLVYTRQGSLFTGFEHKVRESELARLDVRIGASAKRKKASSNVGWSLGGVTLYLLTDKLSAAPGLVRHYVTEPKGVTWLLMASQHGDESEATQESRPRAYKAGRTYQVTFNQGVFGPSVGKASDEEGVHRTRDTMNVCIPMFTDGAGHLGDSALTKAATTVTVNGDKRIDVKEAPCDLGLADLPTDEAAYKISTDVSRSAKVAGVSTRIKASWTYRSALVEGDEPVKLPLYTVRFAPKLALDSTAKAGASLTVPLVIEGPAAGGGLHRLAVDVSYDGGTTWKKAPVSTAHGKRVLKLKHPRSAESVSFQAELTDTNGNAHGVTIYNAYRLVP